jgi:seryl-tRNA synthetase
LTSRKESEFVVSELKELKDERQQLRDKLQEVQYTVVDSKHISQNLQTAVQVDFNISLETNRALMDAIIKGEQELEELAEMIKQFDEEYGFNKLLHTVSNWSQK